MSWVRSVVSSMPTDSRISVSGILAACSVTSRLLDSKLELPCCIEQGPIMIICM